MYKYARVDILEKVASCMLIGQARSSETYTRFPLFLWVTWTWNLVYRAHPNVKTHEVQWTAGTSEKRFKGPTESARWKWKRKFCLLQHDIKSTRRIEEDRSKKNLESDVSFSFAFTYPKVPTHRPINLFQARLANFLFLFVRRHGHQFPHVAHGCLCLLL